MKYFIIYFYLFLNYGTFCKDLRVVGGSDADIKQFPYYVSLRHSEENILFCGGTIISNRHILTAAHCLYLYQDSYENITIYTVETPANSSTGISYNIDKIFIHPDFTSTMTPVSMNEDDISVIKLIGTILLNKSVNLINLPIKDIPIGVHGIISGWGTVTYPNETIPNQLQTVGMRIISDYRCSKHLPFYLHEGQFCAFKNIGVGSCVGDSGGPLVHNNKIIGIISFCFPCACGTPDIFVKVYYYLDFIRKSMTI